jgi:hypothetical protein
MLITYAQFERLHSGIYHDSWHAQTVSKLASGMATAAGFSRKDSRFLAQVALLHNADERRCQKTGDRQPLLPPQVHNTLDWMLANRESICRQFCWTKHNFHMACALIARTCYPFDSEPRMLGEAFHSKSPVEIAAHFLGLLMPEQREDALRLGLILRFADQIANYTGNWKRVTSSLAGLIRELASSGVKIAPEELGSATFLRQAGTDLSQDRALALRFGICREGLFGRDTLLGLLPSTVRRRFDANLQALGRKALAA